MEKKPQQTTQFDAKQEEILQKLNKVEIKIPPYKFFFAKFKGKRLAKQGGQVAIEYFIDSVLSDFFFFADQTKIEAQKLLVDYYVLINAKQFDEEPKVSEPSGNKVFDARSERKHKANMANYKRKSKQREEAIVFVNEVHNIVNECIDKYLQLALKYIDLVFIGASKVLPLDYNNAEFEKRMSKAFIT